MSDSDVLRSRAEVFDLLKLIERVLPTLEAENGSYNANGFSGQFGRKGPDRQYNLKINFTRDKNERESLLIGFEFSGPAILEGHKVEGNGSWSVMVPLSGRSKKSLLARSILSMAKGQLLAKGFALKDLPIRPGDVLAALVGEQ